MENHSAKNSGKEARSSHFLFLLLIKNKHKTFRYRINGAGRKCASLVTGKQEMLHSYR